MSQNSSSSPDHAPGASPPQSLPTVCVYSNNFLPVSKTFVYRQLTGLSGVRIVVATKQIMNPDLYPFSPVCCLPPSDIAKGTLTQHRRRWREFMLEQDVRLVHAHFANNALDVMPVAFELGIPLVITLHGSDVHRLGKQPRYALDYRALFYRAACVLVVSEAMRSEAVALGCPSRKVRLHYLGVPLEQFSYQERRLSAGERVRFLHVSNFVPVKGVPALIRAYKRAHDALPETELILVGEGAQTAVCKELVAKLSLTASVRFLGLLPPAEIPRVMHGAHILVHPSVTQPDGTAEGTPTVITEAMATGMPVIGTRHGGIPDAVSDGKSGFLVGEGDEEGLARRMIALATHPETWGAFAHEGVRVVRDRFDLEKRRAALSRIYLEFAGTAPPHPVVPKKVLITDKVILNGGDAAILDGMICGITCEMACDIRLLIHDCETTRRFYPRLEALPALEEASLARGQKAVYAERRLWGLKMCLAACLKRLVGSYIVRLGRREKKVLDAYAECDVVVSGGGGFLTDDYVTLWNKLRAFQVARILRKPVVIYAQSLGPFRRPRSRRLAARELRKAALVTVRDRASFDLALSLGVAEDRLHLTADAAFDLVLDPPQAFEVNDMKSGLLNIGLSVRAWKFPAQPGRARQMNAAYQQVMSRLCEHLIARRSARLTFISTCQGVPGYQDDSKVAQTVVSAVRPELREAINVNTEFHTPRALRELLARFDAYIGTRMHSIILASLSYVPAVGIAYERKTVELFRELGLSDYVLSIEEPVAEKYIEVVDKLLDSRMEVRHVLKQRVLLLMERAHESAALLKELFDRPPRRS